MLVDDDNIQPSPSPIPLAQGIIDSTPSGGTADVVIPAFDEQQRFTDLPYTTNGDDPVEGQRCLVAFDDQGAGWIIAWT